MKGKVLILGYFGYQNNQLDGQTVKTRNIYTLLKSKEGEFFKNVCFFDTQTFQKSKMNLIKSFFSILKADTLVYLPAHNNLKYLFPIIFLLCKLKKIDLHYIVVGGWLSEFISDKPLHKRFLRKVEGIYPQTKDLVLELKKKYNFNNAVQLNNFRINNDDSLVNLVSKRKEEIRLVFMARIHPMKGVDTIFKVAERLKELKLNDIKIDVYGPIYEDYRVEFETKLFEYDNIFYKDVIEVTAISSVLPNYDLFLFPTKYYTEGFPGSILDAYIAKVPVIATRWKYAEEFIDEGKSGVIVDFDDVDKFVNKVVEIVESPELLDILKIGVKDQAKKFSSDIAWEVLETRMFGIS